MSAASGRAAAQGCWPPPPPPTTADAGTFEHRWAGLVADAFSLDGQEVWTGEDGGRIRHRDVSGNWSFQPVPHEVQATVRRIHFLSDALRGWAVSEDGWLLDTVDGGAGWNVRARIPAVLGGGAPWEDLWDVWFAEDGLTGWLLGLHGIWTTSDGGTCWNASVLHDASGQVVDAAALTANDVRLYALDVRLGIDPVDCAGGTVPSGFLGLATGRPGWILRSTDWGASWWVVRTIDDACANGAPPPEGCGTAVCGSPFDGWDVEIRDATTPLALVVGGWGTNCGAILGSSDDGCTWTDERHECFADPAVSCAAPGSEYDPGSPPYRLSSYRTLYGVGIFDSDGGAIASGYNAQHLFRDVLPGGIAVWRDRSEFGPFLSAPGNATIMPMYGAEAGDGASTSEVGWVTGAGGHIRWTPNGGGNWIQETVGEPFRVRDVFFRRNTQTNIDEGWKVGQRYHIAFSNDGGITWATAQPFANTTIGCYLNSIAFAGDLEQGVTVGCADPNPPSGPKILFTSSFTNTNWSSPISVTYISSAEQTYYSTRDLRKVAWVHDAASVDFWAVGEDGLILHTLDGGASWTQLQIGGGVGSGDPHKFDLRSVDGSSPGYVLMVGEVNGEATAWFCIHVGGVPTWVDVSPSQSEAAFTVLTDVVVSGSLAWAVGERDLGNGQMEGVVLSYDASLGRFVGLPGPFSTQSQPMKGVPECPWVGSELANSAGARTLTRIGHAPNGDLWIGGACGQIWQLRANDGQWIEHKSRTDADVRGLQIVDEHRGYVAGHSQNSTQHALVRFTLP